MIDVIRRPGQSLDRAQADLPEDLNLHLGYVAGYPEWLDLVVSQRLGNRAPRIDGAD